MSEKLFILGNEAVGWGALMADCDAFFGYPITPQNETIEWFAREYPERGRVFFQTTSETSAINMVYGAAACGVRAMTSTSGPGWSLMHETMSHMANAELPAVVVLVQRGGPGQGTTRQGQMDYYTVTKGGGHGGYKTIVLCPASVQETHDLIQLAFHLADKYRNPVVVLTDAVVGMTGESVEVKKLDFGSTPAKDWALRGLGSQPDGRNRIVTCSNGLDTRMYPTYLAFLQHLQTKYESIANSEARYEAQGIEDADLILVAYGYPAGACREAVGMARADGLRVGLLRLITAWPFPTQAIRSQADRGVKFLVIEDSLGQMVDDVLQATGGRSKVSLLGVFGRHSPAEMGLIFPERVLDEARRVL
ncbi:3-methyl-2-oxobutanoate dehydrogenase subunit beta [Chloroflexota bacterium]